MGRKPLSGKPKGYQLHILLNEDEKELLDSAASQSGQPTSTWARDELIGIARKTVSAPQKRETEKKTISKKKA